MSNRVIVIGGGAAGLIAAGFAGKHGSQVLLLEKNNVLAKKIRITGKGRCNITNGCDLPQFITSYPGNGNFLYSALHQFNNWDLLELFNSLGVETKEERGKRIFPSSDDAHQVADALVSFVKKYHVDIRLSNPVKSISRQSDGSYYVTTTKGNFQADRVIITTGGLSYPKTGSTGDGYKFAKDFGHQIQPPFPALVGLKTREKWVKELSGLSLKNVEVSINHGEQVFKDFGEMQFAHFGVTGPIILTLSRQAAIWLRNGQDVNLSIDLKPALNHVVLDQRLQKDFLKYSRKQIKNSLGDLLPSSLIPVLINLSGIDPETPVNQLTKEARQIFVNLLKKFPLSIQDTLAIETAIVTAGGVHVSEIDPKTMESKIVKGLYFAGEVLDIDGITGGFNLQAAFSTGYVAGINASQV